MIWAPVLRKAGTVMLGLFAVLIAADMLGLLQLATPPPSGTGSAAPPEVEADLGGGIAAAALGRPPAAAAAAPAAAATASALPPPPPPLPAPPASAAPPPPAKQVAAVAAAETLHLPECATEPNTDRPGNDLGTAATQESSAAACCSKCTETPRCRAWSFVHEVSTCWLKGGPTTWGGEEVQTMPAGLSNDCCTSGLAPADSQNAFGAASAAGHSVNGAAAVVSSSSKSATDLRGGGGAPVAPPSAGPASLLIAIPTIPRLHPKPIDYLTGTVESLVKEGISASQSASILFSSVEIMVLSHVVAILIEIDVFCINMDGLCINNDDFNANIKVESEHPDFVRLFTEQR